MTKDEALDDLKAVFGKQRILYSDDLADYLGKTKKALERLKASGGFPVPIKKIGGKIGVHVLDLATWLADAETPAKTPSGIPPAPALPPPARKHQSMGAALLTFRHQIDFLESVYSNLQAIEIARELAPISPK